MSRDKKKKKNVLAGDESQIRVRVQHRECDEDALANIAIRKIRFYQLDARNSCRHHE